MSYNKWLDLLLSIVFGFIIAGCIFGLLYWGAIDMRKEIIGLEENLKQKDKIIKYEYGRTFDSFDEYIVYRADFILNEKEVN